MDSWEQPIVDGLAGMGSFLGAVSPYLFPILILLFIGGLLVGIAKSIGYAVS
jgi:hypothetical protein